MVVIYINNPVQALFNLGPVSERTRKFKPKFHYSDFMTQSRVVQIPNTTFILLWGWVTFFLTTLRLSGFSCSCLERTAGTRHAVVTRLQMAFQGDSPLLQEFPHLCIRIN